MKKKSALVFIQSEYFVFCQKFINVLMMDGKKMTAYKLFFESLEFLKKRIQSEKKFKYTNQLTVLECVFQAIENVKPSVEVKKVRVAGNKYLVPAVLSKSKQETYAMKWIIEGTRRRKKTSRMSSAKILAEEILEASKKQGFAIQKRDELHRLAEANRAYIRYRWW